MKTKSIIVYISASIKKYTKSKEYRKTILKGNMDTSEQEVNERSPNQAVLSRLCKLPESWRGSIGFWLCTLRKSLACSVV